MAANIGLTKLDTFDLWYDFPEEIRYKVIKHLIPSEVAVVEEGSALVPTKESTDDQLRQSIQDLSQLRLVDRSFNIVCSELQAPLITRLIESLTQRYNIYNESYEFSLNYTTYDPKGPPQLLDALFTECDLPLAKSSLLKYDMTVEKDIKFMITFMLESMDCVFGELRCRSDVTPLHAAVANNIIPVHIIKFMFEHGADANATFKLNGSRRTIYEDIHNVPGENTPRIEAIQALFVEYGYLD